MAVTPINGEDQLVQETFAEHLEEVLGWDSIYAWNQEIFGPEGTLGRCRHQGGSADPRPASCARNG